MAPLPARLAAQCRVIFSIARSQFEHTSRVTATPVQGLLAAAHLNRRCAESRMETKLGAPVLRIPAKTNLPRGDGTRESEPHRLRAGPVRLGAGRTR